MFVSVLISLTLAISLFSSYCLRANVLFRSGNETSVFFVSDSRKEFLSVPVYSSLEWHIQCNSSIEPDL